jgi:paired amphipathic helix protein Sin3a
LLTGLQVYAQVTALFRDAPDLLDEFKQFLPDTSQPGSTSSGGLFGMLGQASNQVQTPTPKEKRKEETTASSKRKAPPTKDEGARPARRGKKEAPYAPRPTTSAQPATGKRQRAEIVQSDVLEAQQSTSRYEPLPPPPRPYYTPAPLPPPPPPKPAISQEEIRFFDNVFKYIDDRPTYHEFLKLLNLFTQDIIDLPSLVSRAHLFLSGAPELWTQFREMVGWQDGQVDGRKVENGVWILENEPAVGKPTMDLSDQKGYGPSYRKLPTSVSRTLYNSHGRQD